jgi:hypothetical protein
VTQGKNMKLKLVFALLFSVAPSLCFATCTNFIGMNIADQSVGKQSMSQLWNPPSSGKVLSVSKLTLAVTVWGQTPAGTRAADIVVATAAMTTPQTGAVRCKDLGDSALPGGEMRIDALLPGSLAALGRPIYELWPSKPEDDRTYTFDPPIVVPPGYGLTVRGAQTAMYVVTSWQWTESAVTP